MKNTRNSIMLAIFIIILVLVYARAFLKRPSRKRRLSKSPVAEVEKKKEEKEVRKIEPLPERVKLQEWGRSPFILPGEIMVSLPEAEEKELVLTGITWKQGRALALIGDKMVREGDTVDGKKVAKVKRNSVILREGKREYILMLREEGRP